MLHLGPHRRGGRRPAARRRRPPARCRPGGGAGGAVVAGRRAGRGAPRGRGRGPERRRGGGHRCRSCWTTWAGPASPSSSAGAVTLPPARRTPTTGSTGWPSWPSGARRRHGGLLHRHPVRPAPARRGRGARRRRAASGATRPRPGSLPLARRGRGVAGPALRAGRGAPVDVVAACVGTKEFVASVPHILRLRHTRARHRAVPGGVVPDVRHGRRRSPAAAPCPCRRRRADSAASTWRPSRRTTRRAPWCSGPTRRPTRPGGLGDLGAEAAWGRAHGVPVFSDECYAEFTWDGPPRSVLQHGPEGVVAVHSLSKRSNLAGVRVGLLRRRRRAGRVPARRAPARRPDGAGPGPGGGRRRPGRRRARGGPARRATASGCTYLAGVLGDVRLPGGLPEGGFYLWVPVPADRWPDAWAMAETLRGGGRPAGEPGRPLRRGRRGPRAGGRGPADGAPGAGGASVLG